VEQSKRGVVVGEGEEEGHAAAVAAPEEAGLEERAVCQGEKSWERKAPSARPCRAGANRDAVHVAACPWLTEAQSEGIDDTEYISSTFTALLSKRGKLNT
jgi:hypothetical protein